MKKISVAINSTSSPARVNGSYAKCGQMSKRESEANHVRVQNRNCKNRQGPGHVTTHSQEPREHPFSAVITSNGATHSHQRRWSGEFCKSMTSPVITVKKNKKEPQPPQREVSLLRPHAASHHSCKRYSCPPMGAFSSASSSSASSSTSSCSSPPPVQTSVITGPDPLGWKLRTKSSSTSRQARTNRLSLQIPLPVISPEPKSNSAPNSQSDTPNPGLSPETKPPPKPSRRRHSDSSAFLRSLPTPQPTLTVEELCAVKLRPLTLLDESDDVFSEEEVNVMTKPRKIPPPVPEKTFMARQIAQLMAHSRQGCKPVAANKEIIYSTVIKPKPKHSHKTETTAA